MYYITCGFTGIYILLLLFCVGKPLWIEVTSRKELVGTVLLLVLGVVCKLVCLITSAKALHENGYVIEKEGLKGLFGRGLKARLITNIMQSMVFSVAWKAIEEQLNKPKAKPAACVDAPVPATKAVWTLPPVAGLSMESDAKAVVCPMTHFP